MFRLRKSKRESADIPIPPDPAAIRAPVACMLSDTGCCRELNEDNARIVPLDSQDAEARGLVAVVADGMGGHQSGEVASLTAVETIEKEYSKHRGTPGTALEEAFQRAHRAILKLSQSNSEMSGMGTTCTALAITGRQAWAAHVGDSRLYLVRGNEIYQLSEDHTQCMDMVRRGLLSLEEAKRHTDRNVLTHAMGTRSELTLMTWPKSMAVKPGDVFVLCSDGLHDLVSDAEIRKMAQNTEPSLACRNLVQTARDRGGYDNITLVVIAVPPVNGQSSVEKVTRQYEAIK